MRSIAEFQPQLEAIMKGIAAEFGTRCEVVLHDHSRGLEHSIAAIENGHLTGRAVGGPSTDVGFAMRRNPESAQDQYGYVTQLKNGRTVRSTSVYFRDDDGRVLGALCINLDITDLRGAATQLQELTEPRDQATETFGNNVGDILDNLIHGYLEEHRQTPAAMKKRDMVGLIAYLDARGAFLIRNAAARVCELLQISKFTLYAYLKEVGSQRSA